MEQRISEEYSSKASVVCNKVRKLVLQSLDAEKSQENAAVAASNKSASQFATALKASLAAKSRNASNLRTNQSVPHFETRTGSSAENYISRNVVGTITDFKRGVREKQDKVKAAL